MGTLQDLFNEKFYYYDGFIIRKKYDKITGVVQEGNYLCVEIGTKPNKKRYKTHRVIWMMHYGDIPSTQIVDHIDGNTLNNRIENLRLATKEQNRANSIGYNQWGLPKGVSKRGTRFVAKIGYHGVRYYLGSFSTVEEAVEAYTSKSKELYGEFANLNRV